MTHIETDCLIIGSGIGGATVAMELAAKGVRSILITRAEQPDDTATVRAQGGIVFRGIEDSPENLACDIDSAGAGLCYRKAVEVVATEGPQLVKDILIDRLGVPFDRNEDQGFHLTGEAAHSVPRILHVGDHTGREIETHLLRHLAQNPLVTLLPHRTAVDLLTLSHHSTAPEDLYEPSRCIGAYIYHAETDAVQVILAKETVLATGGLGQVYLHTTNPRGARGDGVAMAYRTGARIMNLEYIQFHPTALYQKRGDRFLITEAMRGEGARLYNQAGEEFMRRYDPRGTLAPRDIVSRAIHDEMLREGSSSVYLDISHKPAAWIRKRFPAVDAECQRHGIDITAGPIPVVPAAHYSCGGVAVDLWGRSTVCNLSAVGEVACTGVHGANRLASVSLLEGLVFGVRTAQAVADRVAAGEWHFPEIRPWIREDEPVDQDLLLQDWLLVKHTMWNYVGVIRTAKRLDRAHRILRDLADEVQKFYRHAHLCDELIGLRHALTAAQLVLTAAQRNPESRGCHYVRQG